MDPRSETPRSETKRTETKRTETKRTETKRTETIGFAVDSSLGKLAKWLRILGFDALYVPGRPGKSLFSFAKEKRVLLTRSTALRDKNPGFDLVFIRPDNPKEQVRQVVRETPLSFSDIRPFPGAYAAICRLRRWPGRMLGDKSRTMSLRPRHPFADAQAADASIGRAPTRKGRRDASGSFSNAERGASREDNAEKTQDRIDRASVALCVPGRISGA